MQKKISPSPSSEDDVAKYNYSPSALFGLSNGFVCESKDADVHLRLPFWQNHILVKSTILENIECRRFFEIGALQELQVL